MIRIKTAGIKSVPLIICKEKRKIMKKRFLWIMVAAGLLLLAGCGKKNTDGMSVSDTEAAEMEALDFDASDYVKLGDYKKLPVKYPVPTVTDEDVQSSISDLIDENTEYNQVERAILNGDYVSIDFTGTIDGKEFEGGSAEDYEFTMGEGEFLDDFESNLIGKSAGDTTTFKITFPDDYDDGSSEDSVAGKEAEFTVKINSVSEVVVPEYNDAFVASVTDYDTTAAYEDFLREDLMQTATTEAQTAAGEDALSQAIDNAKISGYPQELYDFCYNDTVDSYRSYAEMFGMDYEEFMSEFMSDEDLDEITKNWVNEIIVSKAIADKEGFAVTDQNYEENATALAEEYGYDSLDTFLEDYGKASVIASILREKTISFLYENAEVTEVSSDEYYGAEDLLDTESADTEAIIMEDTE